MGFILSILYFVTYYLTPTAIFGPLAAYRIELVLAVLVFVVSVPAIVDSFLGKTPQTLALLGLAVATLLSVIFGVHWAGGALQAFLLFIPNAYAFFLVCLHCRSKKKFRILVGMLLFVCLFVIGQGVVELHEGLPDATGVEDAARLDPPYFLGMNNDLGERFYRLRGLGEINDPNDFGQLIVCVTPLVFIFWRPRRGVRNFFIVLLPVAILMYGAYLTHSRGAIVALLAVVIVAGRKRIGTVKSLIIAGALYGAASALHFAGGREISADAGQDRLDLWSAGLQLLKSHPIFGVGFNQMPEYAGLTAHNSVVVCAAELGLFGLFFWSMFLFPTLRDTLQISSPAKVSDPQPVEPDPNPFPRTSSVLETLDKEEVNRYGRLMLLSLTGFLVAGWFLSRAFVMTLFLLGGMSEVLFEMGARRRMLQPRWPVSRILPYSAALTVVLVITMYIMLRVANLMR